MKIGIFDSGLGGLVMARAIMQALPQYDYVYLGDTAHVPYGNRSDKVVHKFTREACDFLFRAEDCALVIVACNTASAFALRRLQQEYLRENFQSPGASKPHRRILGMIVPTAQEVARKAAQRVGVLATQGTVTANSYVIEIGHLRPELQVIQQPAPMLVPLIENNALDFVDPFLRAYTEPLLREKIDTLVLGCTHYPIVKERIRALVGPKIQVISQDEFLPQSLKEYLERNTDVTGQLSRNATREFLVSDMTPAYRIMAERIMGRPIDFAGVTYSER